MSNIRAGSITATTTVQRLPNVECKRVHLAESAAYVGGSNLTAGNPPTNGYNFAAANGDVVLEVANLDEIYVVHATGAAEVYWLVEL